MLAWIGIALIALIMVASITLAEPMNSKFHSVQNSTGTCTSRSTPSSKTPTACTVCTTST